MLAIINLMTEGGIKGIKKLNEASIKNTYKNAVIWILTLKILLVTFIKNVYLCYLF